MNRLAQRQRVRMAHATVAVVAMLLPATFLVATAAAEVSRSHTMIAGVKHAIVLGVPLLAVAVAATVLSGRSLAGRSKNPLVRRKLARVRLVAPNALVVLVPAAITLDRLAANGDFGAPFVVVQAIELVAAAVNLTLLGLNMRDGLALRARRTGAVRRAA